LDTGFVFNLSVLEDFLQFKYKKLYVGRAGAYYMTAELTQGA
jgi:hypothetical protein